MHWQEDSLPLHHLESPTVWKQTQIATGQKAKTLIVDKAQLESGMSQKLMVLE